MAFLPASDTLGGVRLGLRLKNSAFLAEAPEAIISKGRSKVSALADRLTRLREQLGRFG